MGGADVFNAVTVQPVRLTICTATAPEAVRTLRMNLMAMMTLYDEPTG